MTSLATAAPLRETTSPLSMDWYFDPKILALERSHLFAAGPGYVGHELMVPNQGDFTTLHARDHAQVLIRNQQGTALLSNICRHRQAMMLSGRGSTHNIVCPLHRWTYNLQGELLGAPHFTTRPCLNLHKTTLQRWNGLLFDGPRDIVSDLAGFSNKKIDFAGYCFDHVEIHECAYNWKTFIEVYLEDYHVAPFHPGLGQFVNCDDLHWEFGQWYCVQTVGVNHQLAKPGTPTYARWHQAVIDYCGEQMPTQGAIWMLYYPNIMVEWYPHVLVISTLIPRGPQQTTNIVEFYYPEEIVLFEREFIAAERAAYLETVAEDDEIALRMDAGRKTLYERGLNEVGPYQSPMEDGMRHFHEWIRRTMNPHL